MCEYLIPILLLTATPNVTEGKRRIRNINTSNVWERSNMLLLLLLSFRQLVVWPMRLDYSVARLHPALLSNWGSNPTAWPCPGFDVDLPFNFFNHWSNASGVFAPAVDMWRNFRAHPWTWSYQNMTWSSVLSMLIILLCYIALLFYSGSSWYLYICVWVLFNY